MTNSEVVRTLGAAVALVAALGGCAQGDGSGSAGGDSSCAALIDYAGHRYAAHGELVRTPDTTRRTDSATAPGCDDGNGAAPARQVKVAELVDIPRSRAVLVAGELYVRVDRPFPEEAREWFQAPRCRTRGHFEIGGEWIDVQEDDRRRVDGDLRPPYRVGVRVTDGPRDYVGTTIAIRATTGTEPDLDRDDLRTSLWEGGGVQATVHCVAGTFVATALTSTPG